MEAVSRGAPAPSTLIGTFQGPVAGEPILPGEVLLSRKTEAEKENAIRIEIETAIIGAMMIGLDVEMTGTSPEVLRPDVYVAVVAVRTERAVGTVAAIVTGTEIEKGIRIKEFEVAVRTERKIHGGTAAGRGVETGAECLSDIVAGVGIVIAGGLIGKRDNGVGVVDGTKLPMSWPSIH